MPRASVVVRLLLAGIAAACGGAPASAPRTGPAAPVGSAAPGHAVDPWAGAPATAAPSLAAPAPAPAPVPPPALPSPERVAAMRTSLREALAVARKRQIARLRAYRVAGRFPVYPTPFGARLAHRIVDAPLFVDRTGSPCAVAYLMQRAGWDAEVAVIATADPTVHVEEVTTGPIVEWVLRSGLTQDEATLIQPDYKALQAKLARELARERRRLRAHFLAVEKQLIANTEVSLDIATVRLLPAMLAGGSLDELADRAPPAAPPPGA